MENSSKNIQIVSLYFLLVTGSVHFLSGMMGANNIAPEISIFINNIFDLPLVISILSYFGATLDMLYTENRPRDLRKYIVGACAVILVICIIINIVFNDTVS